MTSPRSRRPKPWALALAIALSVVLAGAPQAGAASPAAIPVAGHVGSIPTVGPLFFGGPTAAHRCTATVVSSPAGNLILTAAHCISGTGAGVLFAPGYLNGATPYGVWTVSNAFVDSSWTATANSQDDFAVLRIAPQVRGGHLVSLQSVTGGNLLSLAPRSGTTITVPAYAAGINDAPISCRTKSYVYLGYSAFDCHGYVGGTSGSPMLVPTSRPGLNAVAGVIGGLHQGGCVEYTSYSSAFRETVIGLWLRAIWNRSPDVVRRPGSDGC
ncbi:V8-like Glu-specific endopeptidase [Nakamurella sp. UYEF19]|uniref:trypsin-like serine peptidase n=1 Tax=Nakamurella sp. UYEF19 TaxID=1756392 RepID=UPI003390EAE4